MPETFEKLLPAPGRDTSLTGVFAGRLEVDPGRVVYEMHKEGLAISFWEIRRVSKVRVGFPWGVELEFNPRTLQISAEHVPGQPPEDRRASIAEYLGLPTALVSLLILVERMPPDRSQFIYELVRQLPPIYARPYIDHLTKDTPIELRTADPEVRLSELAAVALARESSGDTSEGQCIAFHPLRREGRPVAAWDSIVEVWEPRSIRFRFTGLRRNEERVDALVAALRGAVAEAPC